MSLKIRLEEAKRKHEVMKIQMMNKEKDCEKIEEEGISLRVQVDNINKKFRASQVIESIVTYQRSPFNNGGIGYIGETS
jgi:hypothetical protein